MKIQSWGNSAAVRIPAPLLKKLKIQIGQRIDATIVEGALVLKPAKQRYQLNELIAQCDQQAERHTDAVTWQDDMPAVGKEVW